MAFLDLFNFDREFFVPNIPMHIARSPKERSQVQPKGSQGPSESGRRVHSQETLQGYSRLLDSMRIPNLNRGQDTRANRARHTTRQAHNHTQNSNSRTQPDKPHVHTHTHTSRGERCPSTDDTAPHHSHTHSATPTRERTRQWNHRLRELHRPLRQRLRPLPPLLLHLSMHLPLSPNLVELAAPWPSGVRRALTSGTRPAIAKAE